MKVGNVTLRCPDGEVYKFKKGVAVVPGMRDSSGPCLITIKQFKELVKEMGHVN